jgi:hypothetical protein
MEISRVEKYDICYGVTLQTIHYFHSTEIRTTFWIEKRVALMFLFTLFSTWAFCMAQLHTTIFFSVESQRNSRMTTGLLDVFTQVATWRPIYTNPFCFPTTVILYVRSLFHMWHLPYVFVFCMMTRIEHLLFLFLPLLHDCNVIFIPLEFFPLFSYSIE